MSYVKRIWNTAQHYPAPNLTQAEMYAQAKKQTTKYLREETRIPIAEIKKKIDELVFFHGS
jgi:predicted HTH transcriptional regulator